MEIREKALWQIANTVMVNHQFIHTPDCCAEQAAASFLLFKASQYLNVNTYLDFALKCFEKCTLLLPKSSQKVASSGWIICRILNEGWAPGEANEVLYDVDKKIDAVLNNPFEFGHEVEGNFILPHFYLLERHKKENDYWKSHSYLLQNLKDAINRHKSNGGIFSDFSQESIDRFLLHIGEETIFSHNYSNTLHCNTPEELALQAWQILLYEQHPTWGFTPEELTGYISRRISDFDEVEDLNLCGLLGLGLIL